MTSYWSNAPAVVQDDPIVPQLVHPAIDHGLGRLADLPVEKASGLSLSQGRATNDGLLYSYVSVNYG